MKNNYFSVQIQICNKFHRIFNVFYADYSICVHLILSKDNTYRCNIKILEEKKYLFGFLSTFRYNQFNTIILLKVISYKVLLQLEIHVKFPVPKETHREKQCPFKYKHM